MKKLLKKPVKKTDKKTDKKVSLYLDEINIYKCSCTSGLLC